MKKSRSKYDSTSTSTPVSAITTTASTLSDYIMKTKIENTTEGLPHNCFNYLHNKVLPTSRENALTICYYISSLKSEINPSDCYRKDTITLLCNLSIFFKNAKLFKELTREDLLSFLDTFRKIESVDLLHKWVGTYNLYRMQLMRFFKWLYFPDIEQETKTICYRKHSTAKAKRKINLQTYGFMDCRR
jgi:hypothetical protein